MGLNAAGGPVVEDSRGLRLPFVVLDRGGGSGGQYGWNLRWGGASTSRVPVVVRGLCSGMGEY